MTAASSGPMAGKTVLVNPVVATAFATEDSSFLWRVLIPLMRPFMKTPEKGAATSIYLASAAEVEGVTGRYFVNRKPKRSHRVSYDTAVAARLWRVSAELVGRSTDA